MAGFKDITRLVAAGEGDGLKKAIGEMLDEGVDPLAIIRQGLTPALREVGEQFQRMEVFLPEMILAAETMKQGVDLLQPVMKAGNGSQRESKGVVVIGTTQYDVHDIGKNIVATLLEVNGFEVHDLGRDVDPGRFVEAVAEVGADIVGVSSLMTSTMANVSSVLDELVKRELRDHCAVMVGGAPVTDDWARHIGADGTADDAVGAVHLAEKLVEVARGGLAGQSVVYDEIGSPALSSVARPE